MTRISAIFFMIVLAIGAAAIAAQESAPEATVNAFHDALRRGDAKAVMELLAPDAMILESGFAETRAEYERHHLQKDIEFARAVPSVHSVLNTEIDGNVAWITATTRSRGNFNGHKIDSVGVELMVLSKDAAEWRIRAIHWSNRR